jgi:hypothetical protein
MELGLHTWPSGVMELPIRRSDSLMERTRKRAWIAWREQSTYEYP